MSVLTVQHSTIYRYHQPVGLGEHRMLFRPRESYDLRLIRADLVITPRPACLRWLHDPFDNSVAVATFEGTTKELRFESTVVLEHVETSMPDYPLEEFARTYPFQYPDEDFPALSGALRRRYDDDSVANWALECLDPSSTTNTMKILRTMTVRIREHCRYVGRSAKGVQTPEETLRTRQGSCRDFAVLMMEACRSLGIAARFVSGYLFEPNSAGYEGGSSTHAWMQAYLPGAGWIDFDPTNSIIGNRNLIRVAMAWDPYHVLPLWGTYDGPAAAFAGMDVSVKVTEEAGG